MWRQFKVDCPDRLWVMDVTEVDCPDRLWVMDVTEHPTGEGKVYLGVVIDAWSRRVVGGPSLTTCEPSSWSTRCRWPSGDASLRRTRIIAHSNHGSQGNSGGRRNTSRRR